mmetsp:Transcript_51896/g.123649  ORF Transcript_51896/g.123649 Transcript_51896/m.123649 type:complete len:237 (-) Transcript_51896:43-753(-)
MTRCLARKSERHRESFWRRESISGRRSSKSSQLNDFFFPSYACSTLNSNSRVDAAVRFSRANFMNPERYISAPAMAFSCPRPAEASPDPSSALVLALAVASRSASSPGFHCIAFWCCWGGRSWMHSLSLSNLAFSSRTTGSRWKPRRVKLALMLVSANEWKVCTETSAPRGTRFMMRCCISSLAFRVKVRARIVLGVTPRDMVNHAMRSPSTRVFPAPAPAAISSGTSSRSVAAAL